ncbi:uncharacterized protein LOC105846759 isoform X1 [Hydra vulgaris]|uniref:uncharacterized protein LOC105846759 isoform X1 n=1 Tax=Hydra vulgaris TaxID=6087 RepID=UPI001F5ED3C1|nr:uncharacterized protein LOC105846759 [Hydra vulgaris]XP_047146668.1 uncharacterized protein LOC105846759 [Hydra vulgaris]
MMKKISIFKMLMVASAMQLTRQEIAIDILKEMLKNYDRAGYGNGKTAYGNKFVTEINQDNKALSATANTYQKVSMYQEENQLSPLFTSDHAKDQSTLSKLISLLKNYFSHKIPKNKQPSFIGKVTTTRLNRFSKKYKEKADTNIHSFNTNGVPLHYNNWKVENDIAQLNPTIPTQGIPWKKETSENVKWIPWSEKKELYDYLWNGITTMKNEYKKKQKILKTNAIKRVLNDLNELFLLDEFK